jgi:hypothetical protein
MEARTWCAAGMGSGMCVGSAAGTLAVTIALVRQGGLSAFPAADAACVYVIVKGFKPSPLLAGADSGPVARGAGSGPATLASY